MAVRGLTPSLSVPVAPRIVIYRGGNGPERTKQRSRGKGEEKKINKRRVKTEAPGAGWNRRAGSGRHEKVREYVRVCEREGDSAHANTPKLDYQSHFQSTEGNRRLTRAGEKSKYDYSIPLILVMSLK